MPTISLSFSLSFFLSNTCHSSNVNKSIFWLCPLSLNIVILLLLSVLQFYYFQFNNIYKNIILHIYIHVYNITYIYNNNFFGKNSKTGFWKYWNSKTDFFQKSGFCINSSFNQNFYLLHNISYLISKSLTQALKCFVVH